MTIRKTCIGNFDYQTIMKAKASCIFATTFVSMDSPFCKEVNLFLAKRNALRLNSRSIPAGLSTNPDRWHMDSIETSAELFNSYDVYYLEEITYILRHGMLKQL